MKEGNKVSSDLRTIRGVYKQQLLKHLTTIVPRLQHCDKASYCCLIMIKSFFDTSVHHALIDSSYNHDHNKLAILCILSVLSTIIREKSEILVVEIYK